MSSILKLLDSLCEGDDIHHCKGDVRDYLCQIIDYIGGGDYPDFDQTLLRVIALSTARRLCSIPGWQTYIGPVEDYVETCWSHMEPFAALPHSDDDGLDARTTYLQGLAVLIYLCSWPDDVQVMPWPTNDDKPIKHVDYSDITRQVAGI